MLSGFVPLTLLAFVSGVPPAQSGINPPRSTDVFLVAHQDDWQLFMGDVVFKAVRRGNHSVFVYLTAGNENPDPQYWTARERAALQSSAIAAGRTAEGAGISCASVSVLDQTVHRCAAANTASYFLRLPDGRRDGSGYSHNSFQSLQKLRARRISAITAVDTSTSYSGWNDLLATVEEIVRREHLSGSALTVHANDPNAAINPGDHSDHQMAGLAATAMRTRLPAEVIYYVGYALAARPDNRTVAQRQQKSALFLAYDREMLLASRAWSTYRERPRFYSMCMLRTYARKVRALRRAP